MRIMRIVQIGSLLRFKAAFIEQKYSKNKYFELLLEFIITFLIWNIF